MLEYIYIYIYYFNYISFGECVLFQLIHVVFDTIQLSLVLHMIVYILYIIYDFHMHISVFARKIPSNFEIASNELMTMANMPQTPTASFANSDLHPKCIDP